MTQNPPIVNTTAPLANVGLCVKALERALTRPAHLPGMVCFYGPSGWGKSTAAAYTANRHRAHYVECRSTWSRKATLLAILHEMGVPAPKTIAEMTDAICEQLALSGRPLIIDEMDHLVDKKAVEIIRDLYEGSGAAILLIGEERLPKKLERWERFHGRILDFVPAQPADRDDTAHLAKLYCRQIRIADDLLDQVYRESKGSVRRICVNLERIQEEALALGLDTIDAATWGNRPLVYRPRPGQEGMTMALKPIDKTRPEAKRQAIWDAIRALATFTIIDLWYKTDLAKASIRDYLTGLHKAGYIQQLEAATPRTPATWKLKRDVGREAPRVRKDGSEVTAGKGREQLWRTMRILGEFSARDLAVNASTEDCQIAESEAKDYCKYLHKAGYLAISYKGHGTGNGGVPSRYRFIQKRFSGPKPPQVQRIKAVYDPNLGKVVWPEGGGK